MVLTSWLTETRVPEGARSCVLPRRSRADWRLSLQMQISPLALQTHRLEVAHSLSGPVCIHLAEDGGCCPRKRRMSSALGGLGSADGSLLLVHPIRSEFISHGGH